jgi:hypothetical protein
MLPRPLKRSVQLLISCLFLILATGCSDVKFGSDSGGSSKLSASSAERDATPNNTPEAPAEFSQNYEKKTSDRIGAIQSLILKCLPRSGIKIWRTRPA